MQVLNQVIQTKGGRSEAHVSLQPEPCPLHAGGRKLWTRSQPLFRVA